MSKKFDPDNPKCPNCKRPLNEQNLFDTTYYPDMKGTMYVHICKCGAATGFIVMDDASLNVNYDVLNVEAGEQS